MDTNHWNTNDRTIHAPAGRGPHHVMIGNVVARCLVGGDATAGQISILDIVGAPASGPGPHIDPWCESFDVLDGELTFRVGEDGFGRTIVARRGDAVSIPSGVGHAFSVSSETPARYLIVGTAAGIDAFFADAGEPVESPALPDGAPRFDRERLRAAFAKYGLLPFSFPGEDTAAAGALRGMVEA